MQFYRYNYTTSYNNLYYYIYVTQEKHPDQCMIDDPCHYTSKPQAHQLLQEWVGLSAVCIISSLLNSSLVLAFNLYPELAFKKLQAGEK